MFFGSGLVARLITVDRERFSVPGSRNPDFDSGINYAAAPVIVPRNPISHSNPTVGMTYVHSRNAALYGRCSTNRQEQSIEAQQVAMLSWAESHGFLVDSSAIFLEDDISGAIPFADRPKGSALLRLLREGHHKHLIVPKIDRLGRSALDVLNTIDRITRSGVRVHIIDLGGQYFDSGSPIGGMIIAVLAYAAQLELERIRERIKTVLDHKAAKGELTGTVPYGFDAVETGAMTSKCVKIRKLVPNSEELNWLRQMYCWRQGGLSYNQIAKRLNQLGVPTKVGAGKIINYRGQKRFSRGKWQCGNVARVLKGKHTRRLLAEHLAPAA